MPLPDPGEDDGHLISHLVLGQVAEEIWGAPSLPDSPSIRMDNLER
jgi:hypothetical protein